jgi:hypothetical protein
MPRQKAISRGAKVSSMTMPDDGDERGCAVPDRLEFYYGGFAGPSLYLFWNGRHLVSESSQGGVFSGRSERLPAPDDWKAMWRAFEEAGVSEWLPEYTTAHGCCQVTYWYLTIRFGGKNLVTRGSDAYPPPTDHCPDPLGHVLSALKELASPGREQGTE